jgi:hypothetical protein
MQGRQQKTWQLWAKDDDSYYRQSGNWCLATGLSRDLDNGTLNEGEGSAQYS